MGLDIQQTLNVHYSGARSFGTESPYYISDSSSGLRPQASDHQSQGQNTSSAPDQGTTRSLKPCKAEIWQTVENVLVPWCFLCFNIISGNSRKCNHFCKNKDRCGHECCKYNHYFHLFLQFYYYLSLYNSGLHLFESIMQLPFVSSSFKVK